ncbi:MAG: hypothetical protein M1830_002785 [Pleopsidium flavum]|nr:MAG: hypothetical protein M1830_002785 [Pleopsidium flavum]
MYRSPKQNLDRMTAATYLPQVQTRTPYANVSSPCDQKLDSVVARPILPPPVPSCRLPSFPWLYESVESIRAQTASHLEALPQAVAPSTRSKQTMPGAHASATYIEYPHQFPTPSKLSEISRRENEASISNGELNSRSERSQESSHRALIIATPDRRWGSHDHVKKPQHTELTPEKRWIHKMAERKRRSDCSETLVEMRTHFLPDSLPKASSTSQKSIVPRNDILILCLAHIVCLIEVCDILAHELDQLFQKYERERYALVKDRDFYKARYTAAQQQLDALHDRPKRRDPGNTSPASSPASPNRKHRESGVSDDGNKARLSLKRSSCSPDFLPSFPNRQSTWVSYVTDKIKKFIEKRSKTPGGNGQKTTSDEQEPSKRKRKRSLSDSTVTNEYFSKKKRKRSSSDSTVTNEHVEE